MIRIFAVTFFYFSITLGMAQEQAFKIFTGAGKKSSYKKMSKSLLQQDAVFFGELHDNPIAHWLEVEIAKTLLENKTVTFGAEMLETNDQVLLNQFMQGEIDLHTFDSLAGLWNNFETDYLPVLDLAQVAKSKVIATNIPRKYASQVFKQGIESLEDLPSEDKQWIAPLPMPYDSSLKCYSDMLKMMPGGHGGDNFPKAQAIKDATMAHFIVQNMEIGDANVFYHLNGSYHSNNKEGIVWYLNLYSPDLRIANVCVVSQDDISKLDPENIGLADFIIVVDGDMVSSY
jgi:uncharacterized iron-regulated protein